jgi:hypothetical protein
MTDKNSPEQTMREILAASNSLRKTLLQMREEHPNLPKISISVTDSPQGNSSSSSPTSQPLIITIEDEEEGHVIDHVQQLVDQGCRCEDHDPDPQTGNASSTCDCTDAG